MFAVNLTPMYLNHWLDIILIAFTFVANIKKHVHRFIFSVCYCCCQRILLQLLSCNGNCRYDTEKTKPNVKYKILTCTLKNGDHHILLLSFSPKLTLPPTLHLLSLFMRLPHSSMALKTCEIVGNAKSTYSTV